MLLAHRSGIFSPFCWYFTKHSAFFKFPACSSVRNSFFNFQKLDINQTKSLVKFVTKIFSLYCYDADAGGLTLRVFPLTRL